MSNITAKDLYRKSASEIRSLRNAATAAWKAEKKIGIQRKYLCDVERPYNEAINLANLRGDKGSGGRLHFTFQGNRRRP